MKGKIRLHFEAAVAFFISNIIYIVDIIHIFHENRRHKMSVKTVEEDFDRQKTSFFLNREIFMHACISWTFQAQECSRRQNSKYIMTF